jgi:disulfide bond formation protein DsbB
MNMTVPTTRTVNALGLAICAAMLGYALYVQHGLGLEPCPLCIFQRVAVIALGALFLLAALHGPGRAGRIGYLALMTVAVVAGAGVAGRHLWLQSLPPDKVPSCGPGLDFMLQAFPLRDALQMVLSGSGECAVVNWRMLGLAMPGWVLIGLLGLWALALWNNLRRE